MSNKTEVLARLKEKGMRITSLREELVGFILKQDGHWHIQDLAEKIMSEIDGTGIATIYRTVNLLVDEGFLTKTEVGLGPARFEVSSDEHHDHLTCLDCGAILEFENEKIEKLQHQVANELGFELRDHTMELYANCLNPKGCKRRKSKS